MSIRQERSAILCLVPILCDALFKCGIFHTQALALCEPTGLRSTASATMTCDDLRSLLAIAR